LPGVKAVIAGKHSGGWSRGRMPATRDEPPLAADIVRHMAEAVARVAVTVQLRFGLYGRTFPVLHRLHPLSPFHEHVVRQGHRRVTNMVGIELILHL
jgi:hypothetical protein